ncbi:MAG: tRNA (adenosine(37)-N6)-threonylcarbamoyltransferase complex ATPase subunit type 1 TsaE [Bacteroidetes bacterium HGW-Bacteroidetes-6]|jgi:tRNA threonylcarbamoyladenosine biosynthesis protein TsaE|nr:MAG: tRNA (adenosine(37)-N6)-threonylcarbamoyltransferase complex ATPase subunit type 1 TsaE [Bacteroidetes bacterium HGW-Bacteroidetes-6]
MKKLYSNIDSKELKEVARELIQWVDRFAVFAFYGPMGSGKTTIISAINGLLNGNTDVVTSPTFSLVNVYEGQHRIYHFDCYRLEKPEEALNAGLIDMIEEGTICLIEWPELIESYLPEKRIDIYISVCENPTERNFEINIPDHD